MKKRPRDLMCDPFYAQLIVVIERQVCEVDHNAKHKGITLKDSQIQSALIKATAIASGKNPKVEDITEADQILKNFIFHIVDARKNIFARTVIEGKIEDEAPLKVDEWIAALEAVVDSLKTRRIVALGARDYLDFVHQFILKCDQAI